MSDRIQGRCGAIYAILTLGLSWCLPLSAANQFFVEQKDLLAGFTGQTFFLQCENDQPLYAFSMILKYDPLKLKITALDLNGPVVGADARGISMSYDNATGDLVAAVITDLSPASTPENDQVIPASVGGSLNPVLKITAEVLASSATTTLVDFRDQTAGKLLRNTMTIRTASSADSVFPTLNDRTLDILSPAPAISEVQLNTGRPGAVFFVVASNLDLPGLAINLKVCGATLVRDAVDGFRLEADKKALRVVAPACGTEGWAPLELTTTYGMDGETNGFFYIGSAFIRGDANNNGQVDLGDAISILNDLFLGEKAFAPCRDALDTNDSGDLDITDAVILLNFLFLGGKKPQPPYPDLGVDPTVDRLPTC